MRTVLGRGAFASLRWTLVRAGVNTSALLHSYPAPSLTRRRDLAVRWGPRELSASVTPRRFVVGTQLGGARGPVLMASIAACRVGITSVASWSWRRQIAASAAFERAG